MTELGRLLVFFTSEVEGKLLMATEAFREQIEMAGECVSDHDFPDPRSVGTDLGLLIFEGWLDCTNGPDPDVFFAGEWRRLSHWELCRVRYGKPPDDSWEYTWPPKEKP